MIVPKKGEKFILIENHGRAGLKTRYIDGTYDLYKALQEKLPAGVSRRLWLARELDIVETISWEEMDVED